MKKNKLFLALIGLLTIGQFAFAQSGSTFSDPDSVKALPFLRTAETTCGFGNNYTTADISCAGNFMTGNEKIYSFTPAANMGNVQVSMTNIQDNFAGLFIVDDTTLAGNCIARITGTGNTDRIAANLSLTGGTTYYIIVSSWANPQCLSYDFQVLDQTCPAPAMVHETLLTSASTFINWTETGSATSWEIKYDTIGGTGISVLAGTNPMQITGLIPETTYEVYVRAGCSAVDSSYWVGPYTFTTLCATSVAPWIDDVETHSLTTKGSIGNCWSSTPPGPTNLYRWNVDGSGSTPSSGTGPSSAHSGSNYFYTEASVGGSKPVAELITNSIDLSSLTTPQLSFYYHMYGSAMGKLYVDIYDGSAWVLGIDSLIGQQQASINAAWLERKISLSSYSGTVKVRFRGIKGSSYTSDMCLDDIMVIETPTCLKPTNLSASVASSGVSADLSWVETNSATTWEVQYGASGFVKGTGISLIASSTPFNISGLTASSAYDFYVRSVCTPGSDSSYWAGPFSFITGYCTPNPSSVDGIGITNVTMDTINNTTGKEAGNYGDYSAKIALGAQFSTFDISITLKTGYTYNLWAWVDWNNDFDFTDAGEAFYLGESTSSNPTTFLGQINIPLNASLGNHRIRLGAADSGLGTTLPSKPCYTGGYGSFEDYTLLVTPAPSCVRPDALAATNITTTSLDFGWHENGSAQSWEVEYGVMGYTFSTGTRVGVTTTPTVAITGLTQFTSYDFYVRSGCALNDSSIWSGPFTMSTIASCPVSTSLAVANVTATTADFSWVETGSATDWEYEYGVTGFNHGNGITGVISSKLATLTGLVPGLAQDFYVRSICVPGSDTSLWLGPLSFTTLCAIVNTPYVDNVETHAVTTNGSITDCWSSTPNGPTNAYRWNVSATATGSFGTGPSAAYSGTKFYYTEASTTAGTAKLETPQIDLAGLVSPELSFYYHMYGAAMGNLYIDVFNGTSWVMNVDSLKGQQQSATSAPWAEKIVDLSTFSGIINVRFRAIRGTSYTSDIALDDISVRDIPTCTAPNGLTASNITSSSANLVWSDPTSATSWEIEYGGTGFLQGTGTYAVTSTNPHMLTGLNPQTSYQFYVRTICTPGSDTSTWAGPFSFMTGCSPAADYSEDFNSLTTPNLPTCWYGSVTSTNVNAVVAGYKFGAPNSPLYHVRMSNGGDVSAKLLLVSPELSTLSTGLYRTIFYAKSSASTKVAVGTMSNPMDETTFHPIDTVTLNPAYSEYKVSFAGYSGTDTYVVYRAIHSSTYQITYIDDASYQLIPSCIEPKNLGVSKSATTADLSWLEQGSAVQWQVEYGTPGFNLGSGISISTTTNPVNITGLTANTAYEFYVKSVCTPGSDSSTWTGPFAFLTGYCIPSPSSVDGSGITNVSMDTVNNTTAAEPGNYGDYTSMIALGAQSIDLDISITLKTGFTYNLWAWVDWNNDLDFMDAGEAFYLGESTNQNPTTFIGKITIPLNASLGNHRIRIAGADVGLNLSPCYTGSYACFEDYTLLVTPAPSCPIPINEMVSNVAITSAGFGWTEQGSATNWEVEYDTTGYTIGTGTSAYISANTYSITGLMSNTTYDAYVRSVCGAGDTSSWVGPVTFTTGCAVITSFPFLENFDVLSPTIACWKNDFIIGSSNWELNVGANGGSITTTAASGYNLVFVNLTGTNTPITDVVSPVFDIAGLVKPRMSFWYAQEAEGTDQNYLRVMYRISVSDPWIEIFSDSTEVKTWTKVLVDLPAKSATYQIAFRGINNSGYKNVVDEMVVEDTPPNDLTIVSVETVEGRCGLGMDSIRAVIVNNGSISQTGFTMGYDIRGTAITPESVTSTIAAFDTLVYTFTTMANFPNPKLDSVVAYCTLAGDVNTSNDTLLRMLGKVQIVNTFPFLETFANGENGWSIDNTINGSWQFGNPNKANIIGDASGDGRAFATNLSGPSNVNENSFVYSPCFDFTSLQRPMIQMSIWSKTRITWSGANLQYSIDGGTTWVVLGTETSGENWYNRANKYQLSEPVWSGKVIKNGWISSTHDGAVLSGQSDVKFRVQYHSTITADEGFSFDDFAVFEGLTLGNDTVLCTNANLTLSPGVYDGYYWTDSSITPTYYVDAIPLTEGKHKVDVVVAGTNGFKMYDTVVVTVDKPVIALGADTVVCYGASFVLDADTGFTSYVWNTTETTQTITTAGSPSGNTKYYVNGVSRLGCPATDSIVVTVNTEVLVDLGVDTTFFDSIKQDVRYKLDAGPGFASYKWSTGAVTQEIIVDSLNDGQITVVVTNADGCTGSDTVKVIFVLGVNSSFAVSTLTMYPNPATDQITIDVANFSGLDVINVTIVDITGKIIMIEKLEGAGNNFNETYDVSTFATGTYFVQFEANGEVVTRQFVIK